jgi:plasmid stabilization system protein ParE
MKEVLVLVSRTAEQQIQGLTPSVGRAMLDALARLIVFPESAPQVDEEGYETYRQVIVRRYRAIYRYLPDRSEVRVYCVIHTRRRLPPVELLSYIEF